MVEMRLERISLKQDEFSSQEISQVVSIYRREIGQGFLSSLGDEALELIFTVACDSEFGILITAQDAGEGCICGFVCGTTRTRAFYQDFLRKKGLVAARCLAPKLISPGTFRKALETLIYPIRPQTDELPRAELLVIAVDDSYKGTGIAQLLFYELVEAFKNKGVTEFKVVAGEQLARAQRFYQKLGPSRVDSIQVHEGQGSTVYIYKTGDKLTAGGTTQLPYLS